MTRIPRWCWHDQFECVVEVIKTGHFPSTVIVRMPDGSELETDIDKLRIEKSGTPEC
jgi:hypothetical protein